MDARAAAYDYEEMQLTATNTEAARTPTVHWRDKYTGFNRTALEANQRFRGKGVIKLKILAFLNRSARVTVAVGSEALKLAAEQKAAGTGFESRVKERAAAKVAEAVANVTKREARPDMAQYNKAFFTAAAAASDPLREDLGMLDLLHPPAKRFLPKSASCVVSWLSGVAQTPPSPVKQPSSCSSWFSACAITTTETTPLRR